MSKPLEIEDSLQEHDVFVSGIDGRPTHSDSYMTVLDYGALRTYLKQNKFSRKDWEEAIIYWKQMSYLSPVLGLLSLTMERYLNTENCFFSFPQNTN